ncbi:right-handed parallel beta-helix repeat-containing protein [Kitasatospora sp. NPDC088783]|uniref:right-handed parallel beta-helix repeat-containing protein n=1 Tax=Kitasatospora sp. NPDC088783 TaxID=3364077 RepID=UPI003805A6FF
MLHRRLIASAAALAASVAFLPGAAHAADPAPNAGQAATPRGWEPEPAGAKTFTSPADKSFRLQEESPGTATAKPAAAGARAAAVPSTGRTVYVLTRAGCTTDRGTGTQAAPFCTVQRAVDAAVPGDAIRVDGKDEGALPPSDTETVVVRTSGLTITGGTNAPRIMAQDYTVGKPGLTLDGVSDVTVSGLTFFGGGGPGVAVKGSARVTLDSLHLYGGAAGALTVDGASSAVTVARTYTTMSGTAPGTAAIAVAEGAKDVTLAGNLVNAVALDNSWNYQPSVGISATGVQGLNVTNNTVQRGCLPAVAVDGASTAVSVQNNLVVETAAAAACDSGQPAVAVAAESAPATTADYNDFYAETSTGAGPYRWAGTGYPTVAAFRAAVPAQGAHDTVETVAPQYVNTGWEGGVAYALQTGSAAIGTANPSAPGVPATDYFGHGPLADRGAVRYQSNNPGFAMALDARSTSAFGITMDIDVTTLPVAQDIYLQWGDGTTDVLNFYGNKPVKTTAQHIYQKLGDYTVTVTDYEKTGNTIRNTVKVSTLGSQYTAYGPKRLLDSRDGTGVPAKGRIAPYGTVRLKVGGANGIPADATAAVLNVTVTNPAADGHVTAYPEGGQRPNTSNVNYRTGQSVPNLVMVPIGVDGYVDLYNGGWGATDLVADITGYFTPSPAAGYAAVGPTRLVDTRDGTGAPRAQIAGRNSVPVQVAGAAPGLPGGGITAVALNVTVTNPREDGHLIVYPSGQAVPTASNLNFTAGQTVANSVVVPVGADGRIRVFNGAWAGTDVIVDVVGYYGANEKGAFMPVDPERLLDTRDPALWKGALPLHGRYYAYLPMTTRSDIPAFVFNATVTDTRDNGHLSVASDPNTLDNYKNNNTSPVYPPTTSSLNWKRGDTVPNLVQVASGGGVIDFFNESDGDINLIVDIFGYYQNA